MAEEEGNSPTATHGRCSMASISVACYRPKPGCEEELLELVRNHLPPLRAEGLVTDRPSIVMRTADGTVIEIFEWVCLWERLLMLTQTRLSSTCGNDLKRHARMKHRQIWPSSKNYLHTLSHFEKTL